jgi:FAD:protein FMN transferase
METVALARNAMATRFEIVLHGENAVALRAAGEEALSEIERLEAQLSLYRPTSEVAHLNARAAREPVRVEPSLFRLLANAQRLYHETAGAFDITIAPLMQCWGFMSGSGKVPSPALLAKARSKVGMHLIELDPASFSVKFARQGVMIDLGAIGKGYAIEAAAALLREAGVTSAILHGGTSTVYAIGRPPDTPAWNIAIEYPPETPGSSGRPLAIVPLQDEALSVSAVWGRAFQAKNRTYGHVMDPRTGRPVSKAALAAVTLPSAMETDALSTALLTVGLNGHDKLARLRPGMRTVVVEPAKAKRPFRFRAQGIELCAARKSRTAP